MPNQLSRGYALAFALEPTVSREVLSPEAQDETMTAAARLTEEHGFARTIARVGYEDSAQRHESSRTTQWGMRTSILGKLDAAPLLSMLGERGFAWRDVARMVGVSVPAIQKWRKGERCTGANRRQVAALVAMCEQLEQDYLVQAVGSWFEMPIRADVYLTPMDLYVADRPELVFDLAGGFMDPETVLAEFDPDWREKYIADYEGYRADDGMLAIRPIAK